MTRFTRFVITLALACSMLALAAPQTVTQAQATVSMATVNTAGADVATLTEQATRWTALANTRLKENFLTAFANWQLNAPVRKSLGLPVADKPTPPPAIHFAWVENYGHVMTVGPDYVCDYPAPPMLATTDIGAIDAVIGGPIPGQPDHYYDAAAANSTYGQTHKSPDGRFWFFDGNGFARFWRELK